MKGYPEIIQSIFSSLTSEAAILSPVMTSKFRDENIRSKHVMPVKWDDGDDGTCIWTPRQCIKNWEVKSTHVYFDRISHDF